MDGGQWRLFRRLEDERVAGRERRGELPAGHDQREVPRHDGGDHARWLAGDEAQLIMRRGGDFVVDFVDGFGAPADRVGGRRDVDVHRVVDRLAHVEGFEQGEFFLVGQDQIGEADQDALALGRGKVGPDTGFEGAARDGHGFVGIGFVGAGDVGEEATVDRADAFKGIAAECRAVLTVNERTAFYC